MGVGAAVAAVDGAFDGGAGVETEDAGVALGVGMGVAVGVTVGAGGGSVGGGVGRGVGGGVAGTGVAVGLTTVSAEGLTLVSVAVS